MPAACGRTANGEGHAADRAAGRIVKTAAARVTPGARFRLGGIDVDPRRNLIASATGETAVEPKMMDVLCLLARHPGEVLSRETIIDAVWGHAFGADESLTRAVSQLRKALGDTPAPARFIETIPKRGYRLIAPVSDGPRAATPKRRRFAFWRAALLIALMGVAALVGLWLLRPGKPPPADAITVSIAPFEPLGPADPVAARAIRDQLALALARASLIRVTDDPKLRQREDGFTYQIRGTVQRIGAGLRLTIQLRDTAGGSGWSAFYDRPLPLDKARQDELVDTVASELDTRLLGAAKATIRRLPPSTLKPWQLILLATWVPGSDEVFLRPHASDALWLQQRALTLDPNYAPAHASLASALAYRALFTPAGNVARFRKDAARHAELAQAIAPYDVGVLYELATYARLIGDRAAALSASRHVLAIQPGHPVAAFDLPFLAGQCGGGSANAIATLKGSLSRLSPDNPVRWVVLSHLADLHLARGEYREAAERAAESRAIVRMTWSGVTLAAALSAQGQNDAALRVSRETKLEWPGLDWGRFADTMLPAWCLGGTEGAPAARAFKRLAMLEIGTGRAPSPQHQENIGASSGR